MEWIKGKMGMGKAVAPQANSPRKRSSFTPMFGLVKGAAMMAAAERQYAENAQKTDSAQTREDSWTNQITGAGIFGRDKQQGFQFTQPPIFNSYILDAMFRGDAITQKIIEIYPKEAMRKGFKISGDEKGVIAGVMEGLDFDQKLTTAAMWARLYGGAVIMLGINDGRKMDEPVNFDDIRSIDYAHVYDRYQALSTDSIFDIDLLSPNYGNPLLYNVTDPSTGAMYTVHHDRIIRVDGVINVPRRKRANNGWGESIMTACYNYIRDYCSSLGNIATLFNDMVKTVLKMQNFVSLVGSDLESVHARVSNIAISSANNNVMVIDANEELERHALSLSGYPEMFDRLALGLAAVVQVPAGMLFGIEPAGLNASGEYSTKNMYDSIAGYQQSKLAPAIKKFASLVMLGKDYNFGAIPDNWSVEFVPLQQMTELESAEVRLKMAESDKIYIESGVLTPEEVAMSRFGGESYSIDTTIDKALHNDPRFMHEVEAENAEAMAETVGTDET